MTTMQEFLERALITEKTKAPGTGYSILVKNVIKRAKKVDKVITSLNQIKELEKNFDVSKTMDFNNSNAKKIERIMDKISV